MVLSEGMGSLSKRELTDNVSNDRVVRVKELFGQEQSATDIISGVSCNQADGSAPRLSAVTHRLFLVHSHFTLTPAAGGRCLRWTS